MGIFLLLAVLGVGILYFTIHALPEHLAHGGNKIQLQIVAVLAILALFTHNHLFWIAGLLLALIQLPDFQTPIASIASSLEKIAGRRSPDALPAGDAAEERAAAKHVAVSAAPAAILPMPAEAVANANVAAPRAKKGKED
jgi:hypothetical protein